MDLRRTAEVIDGGVPPILITSTPCQTLRFHRQTKHISFGCDRDASHCTAADLIDLLAKDADWTKDLVYDEGADAVYHFDGTIGAIVPGALLSHHDFALRPFAIVTQFRHHAAAVPEAADGADAAAADKHTKEHIICSADDHSEY